MINKFNLFDTNIIIGDDSLFELIHFVKEKKPSKIFILVDKNTKKHCLPILLDYFKNIKYDYIIDLGLGEKNKSLLNVKKISSLLLNKNIDRNSLIINLGGGLICDLGGFIASIIKRGVSFINIPTTLISQVDASIGGKVAVNLDNHKNQIGLFNNPDLILIYPRYTDTQSGNDFLSGKSEIFKYGLILDQEFWNEIILESAHKKSNLENLILKCVQMKINTVQLDYYDAKDRKKLNFGHSVSHAIESCFLNKNMFISHGFALSVGIICESYISFYKFKFSKDILHNITKVILHYFPFISIPKEYDLLILDYLASDKKNDNGRFIFSLINDIGNSVIDADVSKNEVIKSLDYYRACHM